MNTPTQTLLVKQPEAARMLGVSTRTIRNMVATGELKAVRLSPGGLPRIRVNDLVALCERAEGRLEA
jgi:excisionase family DNA binding protein